jgi:cyclase
MAFLESMSAGWRTGILTAMTVAAVPCCARGQDVRVLEVAPGVLVLSTRAGNSIASVGPDGAVLVGVQTPATTRAIEAELARRTRSPRRYVVLAPGDSTVVAGDAGWGALGAVVVAHEWNRPKLEEWSRLPNAPRNGLPPITYSEVIAFDLNGESIHVVHMPPGYSNDDAIAHFHHAGIVHLGGALTMDGYPVIDLSQNGTIDGMIETVSRFVKNPETDRFVPLRGPVASIAQLREYHDMLTRVRDRVRALAKSGTSEDGVVAAHPTAPFDARWGKGPVSPEAFVRMVYRSGPESK